MDTIEITVTTRQGSNQHQYTIELDLAELRKAPNPRQALVTHFLRQARPAIAEVDPSFNV